MHGRILKSRRGGTRPAVCLLGCCFRNHSLQANRSRPRRCNPCASNPPTSTVR